MISNDSTKSEKVDKEIEEIAKQIKETNAKKMVQINTQPKYTNHQPMEKLHSNQMLAEDWTSVQGQFGWAELGKASVPYVTRSGKKYVSMRMAETKILLKYKQLFTEEIRSCFILDMLNVTKAEANLLNEINFRHCDNSFGKLEFNMNDKILPLESVIEMYDFLEFCYSKLIEKNAALHPRSGFIKIAAQNCVPWVWHDNKHYVPLFYFEGECKYLEDRSVELSGWDLAYLKFGCKVQGIRKALFDSNSLHVVELDLIKKFFPPDTKFEWMWPNDSNVASLIQKPSSNVTAANVYQLQNKQLAQVDQGVKKRIVSAEKKAPAAQKSTMQVRPILQKVPSGQMQFARNVNFQNGQTPNSVQHQVFRGPNIRPNPYQPSGSNVPVPVSNPNTVASFLAPSQTSAYRPTYPPAPSAFNATTYKQTPNLKAVPAPQLNTNKSRTLQIPDFIVNNPDRFPYVILKNRVEDREVECINLKPYLTSHPLLTIEEIGRFFGMEPQRVEKAVNAMRIDIFLPNKSQIRYLERCMKYPTAGLIQLADFRDKIPQIRYILSSS